MYVRKTEIYTFFLWNVNVTNRQLLFQGNLRTHL